MSEEKQERPPIVSIKMVPGGVELVLSALNKLPREQGNDLYNEINGQYLYQMQQLQIAAQKAAANSLTTPATPAKKAAKKAIKK